MTLDFFHALYSRCNGGYIELRPTTAPAQFVPLPLAGREWLVEAHLAKLAAHPKLLPYFGVATRLATTHGRYENCGELPTLFADCDFKEHGEEAIRAAVAELFYPPSAVVNTGGGLHLYWFLTEPTRDLALAARLLDLWVRTIPVADYSVSDVARVLRIPFGTLNHKYTPPRTCAIEDMDARVVYDAADLLAHAQQCALERGESVPEAGEVAPPWLLPPSIGQGERHGALYTFMRSIQSRYALTFDEVLPLLQAVNRTRCEPPIPDAELRRYLQRGWRSPDRAGFTRRSALLQDTGKMM